MWTNTFYHDVIVVHFEAGRQFGIWYLQTVEAVSALTNLAEEVRMLVVVVLLAVTVAEFVFRAVAAALDGMYQMVLTEQGESPEDVRLVDGPYPPFQLC